VALGAAGSPLPFEEFDNESTCIIFDWDDTFLPATFIKRTVLRALPEGAVESLEPLTMAEGAEAVEHVKALTRLAGIVREVLVAARRHGHVAIITGARRVMMNRNAQQFLPGLNLPELLAEQGIVTYHTFNSASAGRRRGWEDEGLDKWVMAKASSISKYLKATLDEEGQQWNVLSIGDGYEDREAVCKLLGRQLEPEEQAALQEVTGAGTFEKLAVSPLHKTVKLRDNPDTDSLSSQLELLMDLLPKMVACKSSFDYEMDHPADVNLL